ncbi:hypothetical protein [Helicovermis profundi]|uniref:DUF2513 domain-containing protein n=1 Tax=Helicovermis profundi TaxID=3065157 RepID=A0AAU9EB49_9FIRM|nr:hypothetical protein HLPR_14730 [Clostridia bacterium S502]
MKDLSKFEYKVLKTIGETINDTMKIDDFSFLNETDEILKIRELVYYIDILIAKGYIYSNDDYYEYNENDKVNFKYVNSATKINFTKLTLTDLSKKLFEHSLKKDSLTENIWFVVFSYIITFLLGMVAMYIIKS